MKNAKWIKRLNMITQIFVIVVVGVSFISKMDYTQQQVLNRVLNDMELKLNPARVREADEIKSIVLDGSKYTLGELVHSTMSDVTYEYDPAKDGNTYATIKGNITFHDVPVRADLKYKEVEEGRYELHALTLNDVPQMGLFYEGLIAKMEENCDVKFGYQSLEEDDVRDDATTASKPEEVETCMIESTERKVYANAPVNVLGVMNTETQRKTQEEDQGTQDYLLPYLDTDYLTDEDLQMIVETGDRELVRLIINEMYARHGFVFKKAKNRDYFMSQSWYHPVEGLTDEYIKTQLFNEYEKANLKALLEV
ncbi:MAG: YARHG domain-containing protein, partial [Filifactor alocis]|nr:YARHG domain-containing protein [Filifactor alocis]